MLARVAKFYRPDELPHGPGGAGRSITDALEAQKVMEIRKLHEYYSHPSVNEMKRMSGEWFKEIGVP